MILEQITSSLDGDNLYTYIDGLCSIMAQQFITLLNEKETNNYRLARYILE